MTGTRRSFARRVAASGIAAVLSGRRAFPQRTGSFQHGVASGDPLVNRVILWTRITPAAGEDFIPVEWRLSADPGMQRILQHGLTCTNPEFDYTVKVDVSRLTPATTYYYQFSVGGSVSPVGRTRTLPAGSPTRLRFAVASCANLPHGFFNSYGAIAARADLDFVMHLGDYLYEYPNGFFGDGTSLNRVPVPDREITTLADYRQRHAQYRQDPDLQEAHRQHPWIVVWDDHETANDAYREGAQNHTPGVDGDWSSRRYWAAQAWDEWMPVRRNPYLDGDIYRSFRFGDLADIVMLDTRLAGRSRQVEENSPLIFASSRTLLGSEQEAWFLQQLASSRQRGTRWRITGQQVMMGQLINTDGNPYNSDQWDGYVASRNRVLQYVAANSIGNLIVLTGDIHSSWANEISVDPFDQAQSTRLAVEFVAPSVTSPGAGDRAQAEIVQQQLLGSHPHVKYVNLHRYGYLLVDLTPERAQGEWYYLSTLTERSLRQDLGGVMLTASGENRLLGGVASSPVNPAPLPAP